MAEACNDSINPLTLRGSNTSKDTPNTCVVLLPSEKVIAVFISTLSIYMSNLP